MRRVRTSQNATVSAAATTSLIASAPKDRDTAQHCTPQCSLTTADHLQCQQPEDIAQRCTPWLIGHNMMSHCCHCSCHGAQGRCNSMSMSWEAQPSSEAHIMGRRRACVGTVEPRVEGNGRPQGTPASEPWSVYISLSPAGSIVSTVHQHMDQVKRACPHALAQT